MPETTQFGSNDDSSNLDGALQPNTILVARYKITAVLGGGGQGAVYQARDLNFPDARRFVAVKEMHVTASDPNLRASTMKTFQREANILATLTHPAMPRIYDFFENNERAYLIMEYINGNNLEEILIKTKKLPLVKIIEWAIDLCDVLAYLHTNPSEPIIFRDMKPANIMIDSLGKVRLVDFGIAKIFVSGVKQTMIGTEGYSAPEQYKGNANPLSDVYSLGATLHQVITRKDPRLEPPFSFMERPIVEFNDEATPQLQAIIEKALAFEPENRYQSCADMKADLEKLRYQPIVASGARIVSGDQTGGKATSADGETSFFDEISDSGIQPRWIFKTEDEIRCTPSIYRDLVFIGSYDTNVWAINLSDGSFKWKYATEGGIASSPVVEEQAGLVLFGSEDGTYYAVDHRSGRLSWTYNTGDKIRGSGYVAHGHVFFGSDDGKLYALMANSGRHMWEMDTEVEVRTRPIVTNNRVIFGNESGDILGLELNGQKKWGFRARKAVSSSPAVDIEGVCYIGSFDNYLYAIDADSGYSHWRFRTNGPIISSPCVAGGFVYVGSADKKLYAINTQTGKEKWTFETEGAIVSSPIIHNDVVYFGGTDNKFYAIDAKRGKEIWRYETKGAITSTPIIANDLIIFGSLDMTVYALPLVSQ